MRISEAMLFSQVTSHLISPLSPTSRREHLSGTGPGHGTGPGPGHGTGPGPRHGTEPGPGPGQARKGSGNRNATIMSTDRMSK